MMHINMQETKRRKQIIIGITGGAGSGKSTIVEGIKKSFETEFVHCDEIAKELMKPGKINYLTLVDTYGEKILSEDGITISPNRLTEAAKEDEGGFLKLNFLTHPNVTTSVEQIINESEKHIILIEAALLIESGLSKICNEVWFIKSDRESRIKRIKKSRDWSDDKINIILSNQKNDEFYEANSNFVILNNDEPDKAILQAVERLNKLDSNAINC